MMKYIYVTILRWHASRIKIAVSYPGFCGVAIAKFRKMMLIAQLSYTKSD